MPSAPLPRLREAIDYSHEDADVSMIVGSACAAAIVFEAIGLPEPAAVLAGAVLLGTHSAVNVMAPASRMGLDQAVVKLRKHFGDDRYTEIASRGIPMAYEEIVAFARPIVDQLLAEHADG
jgi:hypothetical protein